VHTSERISKFYDDINKLGLIHPVAEIHKKTKVSKGYISQVLRKIKEPGPDFLDLFYEKFTISSRNKNNMDQTLPIGDLKVTLKDYVDLLKSQAVKAEEREKEYLEIIKSKLISIDANSKEMADDIEALTTEIQAEHRAMMDTMDVAAKQPIGTTRAAAGTVEIASEQEHVGKGKKTGIDKNVATGRKG
jgi:transcriptional regulator with XRE-family HTH domain